jgi:hypothetical protein
MWIIWKLVLLSILLTGITGCTSVPSETVPEVVEEESVEEVVETPPPTPAATEPPAPVYEKATTDDPFLDKNSDGFQDTIITKYTARYDIDYDGKFDYVLYQKFRDFNTGAQREYIESGFDEGVYEKISLEGIENLCQEGEKENAWFIVNYANYSFWHDGYSFLGILTDGEENDIKIRSTKNMPVYEYRVEFNPDGSLASIKKGEEEVTLATWDEETNTRDGEAINLPTAIETIEDLEGIVSELDELLASGEN